MKPEIIILHDAIVDGNTGEVLVDKKPRKKKFKDEFVMCFQAETKDIEKENITSMHDHIDRSKTYEINCRYAWEGDVESYQRKQRDSMKQVIN